MNDILLIVPPFRTGRLPAIGVSQIKANLLEAGFPCRVLYLNMDFMHMIGATLYELIGEYFQLGDFIFSHVLFERDRETFEASVELLSKNPLNPIGDFGKLLSSVFPHTKTRDIMWPLARKAMEFTEAAAEKILAQRPWIVGFSSMMAENCASLASLSRVKRSNPDIVTIMGGANCSGEMGEELLSSFPQLDYVAQGDADHSFVELVRNLRDNRVSKPVAGILSRQYHGDLTDSSNFLKSEDMERLPYPDYDDFFQQMKAFREIRIKDIKLPFEMTRGCAWGARHRCSFCGIDGASYATRRKSAERVINELEMLIDHYPASQYHCSDSFMDGERYHTILPWLSRNSKVRNLFFETSGALPENHVKKLAAAKALGIQPGIESLSNPTLKLMGKPTNAQKNIQTLKWCREKGIFCSWNYLMGVPGESDADLDEIVKRIEAIHHLQPPRNEVGLIWVQRFSKYFDSPSQYGLEPLQLVPLMYYIYPFPENSLRRLSYMFYNNFSVKRMRAHGYLKLKEVAGQWYKSHRRSHLVVARRKERSYILDTRVFRRKFWHRLRGLKSEIYEFCGRSRPLAEIVQAFAARAGQQEVEASLHELLENRLMLYIDGRYLSLAIRMGQGYKFPIRGDTAITEGMRKLRFSELLNYRRLFNISRYRFAVPLLRSVGFKVGYYLSNFPPMLLHGIIYLLAAALGSKRKDS